MAAYLPRHRYRIRTPQTFLLDDEAMDAMRVLSERRARLSSDRSERTITMSTKRKTMQIVRSSSRLSYRSLDSSICSAGSASSSASSRPADGTAGSGTCRCGGVAGRTPCTCPGVSPWYVPDLSRINRAAAHGTSDVVVVPSPSADRSGLPPSARDAAAAEWPSSTGPRLKSSRLTSKSPNPLSVGKGSSSTLPRSRSSPTDGDDDKNRWSSSLPRNLSSSASLPSSPTRTAFNSVISFLFGCGSKRASRTQIKDELAEVTQEMENLDITEGINTPGINDEKQNPKSSTLLIGKKKFNMDPKKGLEYLIENELLKNNPEDIAEFLFKGEGLNKRAIGDYLGEKNDFNIKVLKAFVNLHEFSDMLIVQALRQFLWSFRLPGEAQKIDRMMECFAERYCELNPEHFSSTDTCYVLSFAIIMLNTSLHNPAVKDKPTVERFIDMNRGIKDGKDLPPDLLTRIYDNIKKEPFKIPEDDGDDLIHTFFNPDKEGWLWKQGGRYKTWKRRWFLLKDHCLYYFEFTQDKEPKGIIPLENIQVREAHDRDKSNCFELYAANNDVIKACKTNSDGKVIEGKHTVYRMSAATPEEKEAWMKTIRQSIKSDTPFYSILAARRKKAQHEK